MVDVLGRGAADPSAFAAAWAGERGLVRPRPARHSEGRRRVAGAVAALASVAIVGAVLVILSSPSAAQTQLVTPPTLVGGRSFVTDGSVWVSRVDPLAPVSLPVVVRGSTVESDGRSGTVGLTLLITSLVGLLTVAVWMWISPGRWSRRSPFGDLPNEQAW